MIATNFAHSVSVTFLTTRFLSYILVFSCSFQPIVEVGELFDAITWPQVKEDIPGQGFAWSIEIKPTDSDVLKLWRRLDSSGS